MSGWKMHPAPSYNCHQCGAEMRYSADTLCLGCSLEEADRLARERLVEVEEFSAERGRELRALIDRLTELERRHAERRATGRSTRTASDTGSTDTCGS